MRLYSAVEMTPPRSLGYLKVEWTSDGNWLPPPPPIPTIVPPAKGESGSDRPICSLLYLHPTSSAWKPPADLGKPVTACSFSSARSSPPEMAMVTCSCQHCWGQCPLLPAPPLLLTYTPGTKSELLLSQQSARGTDKEVGRQLLFLLSYTRSEPLPMGPTLHINTFILFTCNL